MKEKNDWQRWQSIQDLCQSNFFKKKAKHQRNRSPLNSNEKNVIHQIMVGKRHTLTDIGIDPFFKIGYNLSVVLKTKLLCSRNNKGLPRQCSEALALESTDRKDWSVDSDIEKGYHRPTSTLRHCVKAPQVACVTRKLRVLPETNDLLKNRTKIKRTPQNNAQLTIFSRLQVQDEGRLQQVRANSTIWSGRETQKLNEMQAKCDAAQAIDSTEARGWKPSEYTKRCVARRQVLINRALNYWKSRASTNFSYTSCSFTTKKHSIMWDAMRCSMYWKIRTTT